MKNKKLIPIFTCALLFCCLAFAAPANTEAKTVKLNNSKKVTKASMKMKVGQKKKFKLKNVKSSQKIKWKSSNSKVVKIKKQKGNTVKIKAKKKGTATVTGKFGKKKVKVKVKVKVKSSSTTKSYTMAVGDKKWFTVSKTAKSSKWTTSNSNVVKIVKTKKGQGRIKCVNPGTATVTGKAGGKTCTYKIKVLSVSDYALQDDWRSSWLKKEDKKIVKEVLGDDLSKYTDAQICYELAMWECDYMTRGTDNMIDVDMGCAGETALKNGGSGGTEAYAEVYYSLLREVGISSILPYGGAPDGYWSSWNLVYLDGEFYNCDIYYLDLSYNGIVYSNVEGDVNQNLESMFLCSDSAFFRERTSDIRFPRYSSLSVPKCTNTKYDDKKYLITDGIADYTSNIFTRGEV